MCERYVLSDQAAAEREFVPAQAWWQFQRRFNVSAAQYVPAIRMHEGLSEGVMLRWGLIPAWAEGRPLEETAVCADIDKIQRSTIYRHAWNRGRRCILPIAGFYAWQLTPQRYRQPYFVHLTDRSVFGLAAIWDSSETDDGDVTESCTVVCVPTNPLLADVANIEHRMPAILRRKDYHTWLTGSGPEAQAVLGPYDAEGMRAHAVSPRINSCVPDDRGLIQPVA